MDLDSERQELYTQLAQIKSQKLGFVQERDAQKLLLRAFAEEHGFPALVHLRQGLQFELDIADYHVAALRRDGRTNLANQTTGAEALMALDPSVNREAFFQVAEEYTGADAPNGRRNARLLNKLTFDDAVAAQMTAPPHTSISFNVEMAGYDTKFAAYVKRQMRKLKRENPRGHDKVASNLRMELTERDAELARTDFANYRETSTTISVLGIAIVVDDLIAKPGDTLITDPRMSLPGLIKGVKLDTRKFLTQGAGRDDPFDIEAVQGTLDALKKHATGSVPPVTLEFISSAARVAQVNELNEREQNFGIAIGAQGFAISKPTRDLAALAGGILDRPELQEGYVAPVPQAAGAEVIEASTRAGGARRPGRFAAVLTGAGVAAAALVGFFMHQSSGPSAVEPVDGGEDAATQTADAASVTAQSDLSVADVVNDDFKDGFVTIRGTRIDFVGEDRSLGIGNLGDLPEDVREVAVEYVTGLNQRDLFETSAEADARLRQDQRVGDQAAVEQAIRTGQPILLNTGRGGPGPGSGGLR